MKEEEKSLQSLPHNERLKMLRERACLSQYDLGDLVGVSWRMIYYYEKETTQTQERDPNRIHHHYNFDIGEYGIGHYRHNVTPVATN